MSVIIGRVSEYDLSNVTVGGKVIFIPPEKRNAASNNFPVGSVAKVTVDKGSVVSIVPPTEAEMAAFTRGELAENNKPPAKFTKSAVVSEPPKEHTPDAPAAKPQPVKETVEKVIQDTTPAGSIISVMIGGTLNLGNYNNVKMEVTATSAEAARTAFQQEINATVGMMQGIIKQVGVK